jgi:hypothetical protein
MAGIDDLLALAFVHCGQRGDLALLVKRGANDLRHYGVADLLGFPNLPGNRGAVAASLFGVSIDERRCLLSRILRLRDCKRPPPA